jgi:hypothetical protein
MRAALDVRFPAEIEGQPTDRWLVESLRNGNGDVSRDWLSCCCT